MIRVNNYNASLYEIGEVQIDTKSNPKMLKVNNGMVYLTIRELRALIRLAENDIKEEE